VVLLADAAVDAERLRRIVLRELGGPGNGGARTRIGVGEPCENVADFPRSYRQAKLALRLLAVTERDDRVVRFDDLGVYRLLAGIEDPDEVERFVQRWIVRTLGHYLDRGGSYDATSAALIVHRNTLKYRLQRIRQITGLDLSDPETCFNLKLATRAWQTLSVLRS
jgi:DNA-binding PucR family transcriptional regulator